MAVELLADARLEAVLQQTLSGWARLERPGEGRPGGRSRLVAHLPSVRIAALELARFTGWVEVLGPEEVRREPARLGAELVELHGASAAEPARPSAPEPGPPSVATPAVHPPPAPAPARARVGQHHRPTLGTCPPSS